MPVPVTPKLTVWSLETELEAVAVTVITVVPASEPEVLLTDRFTVGVAATSLSVMVMFWEVVVPSVIPEEGVVVGVINGLTYAFIGLERTGDVFVYDVTNPNQPTFVQYINTPEDTGTEGLTFISAADSPTGKPLLVTTSEVSKTVAIFEVKVPTYIHDIQGSGTTAALTGTQTIEGIVTRAFQGSTKLNGFYVQEEDADADNDATTSEAIFIYDPSGLFTGNVGDKVRVTGTAGEFTSGTTGSSLTQLSSITSVVNLGASTLPTVTNIQFHVTSVSDLERYEGMLVNISANGAEISAFDSGSNRLFVVAGNTIEFYTVSTTGTLALAGSLTPTITPPVGAALIHNSVAVKNGVVAVAYAVQNSTTLAQLTGKVAFFNAGNGSFINAVDVGALPDMLTFTPDGTKVLVANEGEPNSYGQGNSVDPEGSVSIINIAGGVASATVQTADFTSFNSQIASLKAAGVRITGPGSTVAQDLEPEYIAVSPDGLTATITLQENNAIAILDIASATITQILPLGAKNYNLPGNGIDASDQDSTINGGINIQNWPVFGLYQPDAIASFSINGQAYYITANEGDSRAYTGFNEEIRVGAAGYVLDPTAFPNATTLKQNANLGRLQLTNATGDIDGDGDIDRIESFGARSFSIWNANGTQVFDSGDQLEQITAAKTPTLFNSDGTAATFNTRSD
ncbi:choice-of-anchor I family protein, partial [Dolichospermum sp. ST_con]|nr:choice-of-anchor I family protein [Dolichospermum sp. ST_con]